MLSFLTLPLVDAPLESNGGNSIDPARRGRAFLSEAFFKAVCAGRIVYYIREREKVGNP